MVVSDEELTEKVAREIMLALAGVTSDATEEEKNTILHVAALGMDENDKQSILNAAKAAIRTINTSRVLR